MNPEFLDLDDVLQIHAMQLEARGGSDKIRGFVRGLRADEAVARFPYVTPALPRL